MLNEILEMPGYQLSKEIHAKKVSCEEVMKTYLDHIEKVNPRVNAIVSLRDREGCVADAKEKDKQLAAGNDNGWMHGFPAAIKDLELTKGVRSTFASPIFKDLVPDVDSKMVTRMKEAGSIVIGKTNTPEFGYGSQTYNEVFGATGNPYDASKTCGGSSGGAACSLAMRLQPVADGSDYMGSLRNPAGWCNIYGYRPSVGRVPDPGLDVFTGYLATTGPMARTVADVALLLGTQSGYMPGAPLSRDNDPRLKELTPANVFEKLKKDPKGVKIGWLGNWGGHLSMEKGILETTEKTLKTLETIGVRVDPIKPFYDPEKFWKEIWLPIRHYSACAMHAHVEAGKRDLLKPEAQFEYDGSTKMSAQDVYNAFVKCTAYYNAMMKVYDEYDFLAVPTAQVFPFDKTIHWPKEIEGRKMQTYHNWMEVVTHWTLGSNAVIAAPAGFGGPNNLSIGIQFVAKPGCDFELLQFAKAYEDLNDFVGKNYPTELKK